MRATLAVVLRASTMVRRKAHVSDRRTCRRYAVTDAQAERATGLSSTLTIAPRGFGAQGAICTCSQRREW
jgi:hypothetical protein